MNKKQLKSLFLFLSVSSLSFIYYTAFIQADSTMASRTKGKILLQIEASGEAWYVSPGNDTKYYLGRPTDAFNIMKELGLGITNDNLKKIKTSPFSFEGPDTDGDGLSDLFEDAIGTDKTKKDTDSDGHDDKIEISNGFNATGDGSITTDNAFAAKLAGYILIQAEQNGEAWYINPDNLEKYFLGRPKDAFEVMRKTGLGITNSDLAKIATYARDETIDENNVTPTPQGDKTYTNSTKNFSFSYPAEWPMTKVQGKAEVLFIRNYKKDVIKEKKAVITIAHISKSETIDLNKFKIAEKKGATKKLSKTDTINSYAYLKEVFNYGYIDANETTVYLKISDEEMLMITLFSAGNHSYHDTVLGGLIRSVK